MPTAATLLAEARKALRTKKTETGERNAVVRVLAKHGAYSTPKIEKGHFPSSGQRGASTLRVYIWSTDWGTLVLTTGPSIEGELQWAKDSNVTKAPKGYYHVLDKATGTGKITAAMKRIAGRQQITGETRVTRPKRKKKAAPKRKRKTAAEKELEAAIGREQAGISAMNAAETKAHSLVNMFKEGGNAGYLQDVLKMYHGNEYESRAAQAEINDFAQYAVPGVRIQESMDIFAYAADGKLSDDKIVSYYAENRADIGKAPPWVAARLVEEEVIEEEEVEPFNVARFLSRDFDWRQDYINLHPDVVHREDIQDKHYTVWEQLGSGSWVVDRSRAGAGLRGDDALWQSIYEKADTLDRPIAVFEEGFNPNEVEEEVIEEQEVIAAPTPEEDRRQLVKLLQGPKGTSSRGAWQSFGPGSLESIEWKWIRKGERVSKRRPEKGRAELQYRGSYTVYGGHGETIVSVKGKIDFERPASQITEDEIHGAVTEDINAYLDESPEDWQPDWWFPEEEVIEEQEVIAAPAKKGVWTKIKHDYYYRDPETGETLAPTIEDTRKSYGNNSILRYEVEIDGSGERFEKLREAKAYAVKNTYARHEGAIASEPETMSNHDAIVAAIQAAIGGASTSPLGGDDVPY